MLTGDNYPRPRIILFRSVVIYTTIVHEIKMNIMFLSQDKTTLAATISKPNKVSSTD